MQVRRVLQLVGPRQSGKTTLVSQLTSDRIEYRTLDDTGIRAMAEADPHGFVRHNKDMLIIDECHHVPALFPAVKMVVDKDNRPGQFLLTGSASISDLPSVRESLAGRVAHIRLHTLSQGELAGAKADFFTRCFEQDFTDVGTPCRYGEIINAALCGGFPEVLRLERRDRTQWHRDYVKSLLDRDLKDIARIRRHEAMRELMQVLAVWSAKYMNIERMRQQLSINRATLETYINALEALFIIARVPSWAKTDYGKAGKQKKIVMTDSGLMSSILGLQAGKSGLNPDRTGKLIETFAYNELSAQADLFGGEYTLYHYRDREQREVDFIVERSDGDLLGVEVKAATSVQKSDFKHLSWFRDNIAGQRHFVGVLLYAGEHTGRFGENLWALPFTKLWTSA